MDMSTARSAGFAVTHAEDAIIRRNRLSWTSIKILS